MNQHDFHSGHNRSAPAPVDEFMTEPHDEHRAIIIVGSGPAGLTAALYTARANLYPLVLRGPEPGGQLTSTKEVENYPGFADGVLGPKLIQELEQQAVRFGAELRHGTVTSVELSTRPFRLVVDSSNRVLAESVIIASGASAQYLGLHNEKRLIGHGVSGCATCDGFFFRGQEVAVIGGGDTAMEEALFLTRFATRVYVIHRRHTLRASRIMQERAYASEKITFVWDTVVMDVLGDHSVEHLLLENTKTGERSMLPVQGLFLSLGHKPNTDVFKSWLEIDAAGYIITQPGSSRTNIPGVFAAGDVQDHIYRQAITAVGSGATAGMDAERFLATSSAVAETRIRMREAA